MNKNSTIFDRILLIIERKGIKNVAELADILGYASPQKIYRLKQEEDSKPSYDIINDFSNRFDDLNLRWFITGKGEPFDNVFHAKIKNSVSEPDAMYGTEVVQLRNRIHELEIEKKSLLLALREIGAGKPPLKEPVDVKKKKKGGRQKLQRD